MKYRNPFHKTLTHFKHKIVPSKKIYNRKNKKNTEETETAPTHMKLCDIYATRKK
jgi:hypothetical protein